MQKLTNHAPRRRACCVIIVGGPTKRNKEMGLSWSLQ